MKRALILLLVFSLLLSGCSWMDGEYHSVKPHNPDMTPIPQSGVMVSDYAQLRDALVKLTTSGFTDLTIYVDNIDRELVDQYMYTAIMHVFQNCAIAAYAVEDIHYEYGSKGGRAAVAVDVTYIHNRQEILRIKQAENMDGLKQIVEFSLSGCDAGVVAKVSNFEQMDFVQFISDYVSQNPQRCMETPQVSVSIYPDRGEERVVELAYTYQTSRESLRTMQSMVDPVFSAASMYVLTSETSAQKYEQLYSFLMERFDYKVETSITPAYSLLRHGVGDSKAFATVYRAMCNSAGLECQVITGTKNGEPWYWNQIKLDEGYYHLDLLHCSQNGGYAPQDSDQMSGYVWDYSAYQ